MSVEFSNAYQEILLENLMAIIKQNFVFQTQLKLIENTGKQKEELEGQFLELKKQFEELNNLYNVAKNDLGQIEVFKHKAEQNNTAHEEKTRIQTALNEEMKKSASLKKEMNDKISELQKSITDKNNELNELKDYILRLEGIAPVTKLKKVTPPKLFEQKNEIPKIETPKIENKLQVKVLDGSSF